jgi:uncharacterized membrane protein
MFGIGIPELIIIAIIAFISIVIVILPYWKIYSKAGFSGWLSITMIIPILNIVMLFYLAFANWPVLKNLNNKNIA